MPRLNSRLEIRIDSETLGRLEHAAVLRGTTVADLAREAIAHLLEQGEVERDRIALESAFALGTPVPDDPEELIRDLEKRHD